MDLPRGPRVNTRERRYTVEAGLSLLDSEAFFATTPRLSNLLSGVTAAAA